jgi:hypothetical protein
VLAIFTAGLWLWMAWAALRAKNWARPVSAILLGIGTMQVLSSMLGHSGVVTIGWTLTWLAGLGAVILLFQRPSSTFFALPGPPHLPPTRPDAFTARPQALQPVPPPRDQAVPR